ncbi:MULTISPECIES: type II secretion system F family protein [Streptomyces]|uniref:type II secretion system F family protein n=2 Tax=Streptomyces TaxID=1883 RepID=UPI00163BE20A|nr:MULTISPECIES: type II secretion system F family protein [Streptomyces]MBC2875814.1 type II secretion system F family protein [Streptomyces sp. TYQ1024]UBI37665.1 type II secretion system F family protein [Streptomyces mobaraensis]UKW30252.1 type II secretion system F family protein [Streptomyces sp. TYQ1024]
MTGTGGEGVPTLGPALGPALVLAAVLAVVAAGAVTALRTSHRRNAARRRPARLFATATPDGGPRGPSRLRSWMTRPVVTRRVLPAMAAGGAGLVLVDGAGGGAVGVAAAGAAWWWCGRAARAAAVRAVLPVDDVLRQLPLAADLLAACLAAGAGPGEAAEAVGGSLGGPVGERLARSAAEVRLGGDPAVAWGRLGELPGARGLALSLERAQATGVPAVDTMARLAGRLRAARGRTAAAGARRAGVLATAPLGLCFLPAFLAVGVVPMVIGLASGLLTGR